ncbi:MAG TPA: response regulator [Methanocellaceae archaeon]
MAKTSNKRILVTDDEPEIVDLISTMLEKLGYVALKAYSGRECLSLSAKEKPDLVFLDIMMTPMDGWEVASAMKSDTALKDIPIIMITGKQLTLEDVRDRAQLIENYIMKSALTRDVLKEAIEDVLTAKTRSERILSMADKSGVEKQMLVEMRDRYGRLLSQNRTNKKLHNLLTLVYAHENGNPGMDNMLSSLKKGLDQQDEELSRLEKMLTVDHPAQKQHKK